MAKCKAFMGSVVKELKQFYSPTGPSYIVFLFYLFFTCSCCSFLCKQTLLNYEL